MKFHDQYRLEEAMLPSFIPLPLARAILRIGKSINFLRACCQVSNTTFDY
jgi:gamma-tubulin complex component 3